jgi:hypothetical protein
VRYPYTGLGTTYTANTFKAGVRLAINRPTLLDQERKGATLKANIDPILWAFGTDL